MARSPSCLLPFSHPLSYPSADAVGFTHGWTHSQTSPPPTGGLHPVQATTFSYLRLSKSFLLLLLLQSALLRAARTLLLKQKQGQAIPSKILERRGLPRP